MSLVLHEQHERKMRPLWWVLTFGMYVVGLVIGIMMAAGPLVLIALHPSPGAYFTLLTIPLGVYVFKKVLRPFRDRIWVNTHLSKYLLYEDRVEYTIWDPATKEKKEGVIFLSNITELYYGMHAFRYNYAYRETTWREPLQQFELLPVLYLVYSDHMRTQTLAIPFTNMTGANYWLQVVAREETPLWLTSSLLAGEHYVGDVPEGLLEDKYREAVRFDGNIDLVYRPYVAKVTEQQKEETVEESPSEEEHKSQKNEGKIRSVLSGIGPLAWLVFALQYAGGVWMVKLSVEGKVDPEGIWFPALLMGICGFLFFSLVKRMRWPQIIIYSVVSLISFAIIDSSDVETDPTYLATSSLLGMSVLSPILLGVIYLIIRSIRKFREAEVHLEKSDLDT